MRERCALGNKKKPMDYTIIVYRREVFGAGTVDIPGAFVGDDQSYNFNCPNVNPGETVVLTLRCRQVDSEHNIFTINNQKFDVGLPQCPDEWTSEILLVSPGILKQYGNLLHVESRDSQGGKTGELDDFAIDNVVLYYKTM